MVSRVSRSELHSKQTILGVNLQDEVRKSAQGFCEPSYFMEIFGQ